MKTYRVKVCREYWGYVLVEANSESEAMNKVKNYDYEGEFVRTAIGEQGVYNATLVESEVEQNG